MSRRVLESGALICRAYSDAITQRCFFFEPGDAAVEEDKSDKPYLMMFPPTESGAILYCACSGSKPYLRKVTAL